MRFFLLVRGVVLTVQVNIPPIEFQRRAQHTIPVDKARRILKEMGVADLPASFPSTAAATEALENTPRLTPEQVQEFLRRAKQSE
jgi:hypothetical protein